MARRSRQDGAGHGRETPSRSQRLALCCARASLVLLSLVTLVTVVVDRGFGMADSQPVPRVVGNVALVLVVAAVMAAALISWRRLRATRRGGWLSDRGVLAFEVLMSFALFAFQVYAFLKAGVLTGWDAYQVTESALAGLPLSENLDAELNAYLMAFPNNQFLTWLLHAVDTVAHILFPGSTVLSTSYFAFFSSMCVCMGLFVTSRAVWRLTSSAAASLAAQVLGTLLVGINPWFMIPYTDTVCMPLVAAMLYVGARVARDGTRLPLWLALLGVLGVVGYRTKPTALLVFGTLVLLVAIPALLRDASGGASGGMGRALAGVVCGLVGCALAFGATAFAVRSLGLPSYGREQSYPMEYFLMFGLSEQGTWNEQDFEMARDLPDRASRQAAFREVIARRLEAYGPQGLALHSLQKLMRTYNDGTFAWGVEGGFFRVTNASDEGFGGRLRNLWYVGEDGYPLFATVCQAFWLTTLLGLVVACAVALHGDRRAEGLSLVAAAALSLVLLTLYLVLFETRARYLYHYAPAFILLAVWGFWMLARRPGSGAPGAARRPAHLSRRCAS